jgi:cyclohexanecarboxyl-CoA dehydrogenase
VTAFLAPLDHPAVRRSKLEDLGSRAGGRGHLVFDGLPVPAQDVVGSVGGGFVGVMRAFGVSRPMIALMALGVAQAALDEAMAHARTRESFGRPLGTHQGVAFPLVEHATILRAARLLACEALWTADRGDDPRVPANMVKWWAPRAAMEAVHQALLTLGHLGWTEGGPIAQRMRDVIGLQLADGTAAATKLVVARQLLGRDFAP